MDIELVEVQTPGKPAVIEVASGVFFAGIGQPGPANNLTIGTVTTVGSGDPATATITGASPDQELNLEIPCGPPGPANTLTVSEVLTLSAGMPATVRVEGQAPSQTLKFGIPQGPAGPANTLAIGAVNTLPAGAQATATITGSAPSQTLNLGIPKGDMGDSGAAETPAQVLAKIVTVDGAGSGLDADKLDGLDAGDFALAAQLHDPVTVADSASIDLTLTGQQITASAKFDVTAGTVAEGNRGVTNGDSHDHAGGDGAQIQYSSLGGVPTTFTPSNHDHSANKLAQANTHQSPDTDTATTALHHTLGTGANQAAAGNHSHAQLHDPVTVVDSSSIDLSLTGQQITASAIFGTTAGTVCQGNDSRFDWQTPIYFASLPAAASNTGAIRAISDFGSQSVLVQSNGSAWTQLNHFFCPWASLPSATEFAGFIGYTEITGVGRFRVESRLASGTYRWRPINEVQLLWWSSENGVTIGPLDPVVETEATTALNLPANLFQPGDTVDFQPFVTRSGTLVTNATVALRFGPNELARTNYLLGASAFTGATNNSKSARIKALFTSKTSILRVASSNAGFSDTTGFSTAACVTEQDTKLVVTMLPAGTAETMTLRGVFVSWVASKS